MKNNYKQENLDFLARIAEEPGIMSLPKNIYYRVINKGDGPVPTVRNIVSVYYKGSLISGKVFDDNTAQGYPDVFRLADLITGWQIALTHMHVGDRWQIYIPAEMGYGAITTGGIPKHSTLVFEIELAGIA